MATKVAISFVYYSPKTIKCTQKPKIAKKIYRNRPIDRASERVPFSTSYLQLALAYARNSRVRLYQLRQLKRAKGDPAQLVCFYTTCIRPVSEYVCQVFHNGLPKYLSEELENIQRRALRIIFPVLSYQEALKECHIATLYQRRQLLTERLFSEIKDITCHKLHGFLPSCNLSTVALRRKRAFNVPFCRTNRLKNSFIMYNAAIS